MGGSVSRFTRWLGRTIARTIPRVVEPVETHPEAISTSSITDGGSAQTIPRMVEPVETHPR